jgi:hypothetical protein
VSGDPTLPIAIATSVSAAISGVVAYLTNRSSTRSTAEVAQIETRGDIEKNAFDKAEKFLSTTIDRQNAELLEMGTKVTEANARAEACTQRVNDLEIRVGHYRRVGRRLARGVYELRRSLAAQGVQTPVDQELDDAVLEFLGDANGTTPT